MKDKSIVYIQPSNDFVIDLAQTISSWLIYNSSVSGIIGVQENMIDSPVKSFLVCHQNEWKEATFEEAHPHLLRRRIDFYLKNNKEEEFYFEFKQAKEDTESESEIQRVYNDIVRLAICKNMQPERRCLFLMFGDIESYKKFFINGGRSEMMQYSDCFHFYKSEINKEKYIYPRSGNIAESNKEVSDESLISKFCSHYKPRKDNEELEDIIPSDCYIKLIWTNYSSANDRQIPDAVGVWEILVEPTPEIIIELDEMDEASFIDASTGATSSIKIQSMSAIRE